MLKSTKEEKSVLELAIAFIIIVVIVCNRSSRYRESLIPRHVLCFARSNDNSPFFSLFLSLNDNLRNLVPGE